MKFFEFRNANHSRTKTKAVAHPISIVGGNIAGLSAAYHLARKGCPVTVYESRLWDKPCGGAISIEYANYLNTKLGIDIPALRQPMPPVRFCFANQRCVQTRPLFVIVSRSDLQQQLISRLSREPDIDIRIHRVSCQDNKFLSSQTVLATGFSGFTRRIIGPQWHQREYALAFKCQGNFSSPSDHPGQSMFFDSRLKGYAWVFCGSNGYYNAGIGGLMEKQIIFNKFKDFIKLLRDRLGYDIISPRPVAWKIPIRLNNWNIPIAFAKGSREYIGVGDVLGLAHPIIAAGIEPAWQSGWLLGESYDRAAHSINVSGYRHLLKKNLQLTSRKPFDILISRMLRINFIPLKDQLSFLLIKLFHKQIVKQIKKYPWFAMVHDGKKKIDFKLI